MKVITYVQDTLLEISTEVEHIELEWVIRNVVRELWRSLISAGLPRNKMRARTAVSRRYSKVDEIIPDVRLGAKIGDVVR